MIPSTIFFPGLTYIMFMTEEKGIAGVLYYNVDTSYQTVTHIKSFKYNFCVALTQYRNLYLRIVFVLFKKEHFIPDGLIYE